MSIVIDEFDFPQNKPDERKGILSQRCIGCEDPDDEGCIDTLMQEKLLLSSDEKLLIPRVNTGAQDRNFCFPKSSLEDYYLSVNKDQNKFKHPVLNYLNMQPLAEWEDKAPIVHAPIFLKLRDYVQLYKQAYAWFDKKNANDEGYRPSVEIIEYLFSSLRRSLSDDLLNKWYINLPRNVLDDYLRELEGSTPLVQAYEYAYAYNYLRQKMRERIPEPDVPTMIEVMRQGFADFTNQKFANLTGDLTAEEREIYFSLALDEIDDGTIAINASKYFLQIIVRLGLNPYTFTGASFIKKIIFLSEKYEDPQIYQSVFNAFQNFRREDALRMAEFDFDRPGPSAMLPLLCDRYELLQNSDSQYALGTYQQTSVLYYEKKNPRWYAGLYAMLKDKFKLMGNIDDGAVKEFFESADLFLNNRAVMITMRPLVQNNSKKSRAGDYGCRQPDGFILTCERPLTDDDGNDTEENCIEIEHLGGSHDAAVLLLKTLISHFKLNFPEQQKIMAWEIPETSAAPYLEAGFKIEFSDQDDDGNKLLTFYYSF